MIALTLSNHIDIAALHIEQISTQRYDRETGTKL